MGWLMAIDVGSSSTAAAMVAPGADPTLLSFGGSPVLPSGVLLTESGTLLVGTEAEQHIGASPDHYERSPKRRLGDQVILLGGRPVEPVDAIAAVLREVLDTAVRQLGSVPDAVRMTVPARWGGVRSSLLAEAARRAGLPEPVLVPEPVAAALFAAETTLAVGAHVAVYALGGGTAATPVLRRPGDGFAGVGAPGGNDQLGGELFDELVVDHLGARIAEVAPDAWEQIRFSSERPWRRLGHELRVQARRAKEALSSSTEFDLYLGAPLDMEGRVTRDELETLLRPALKESVAELVATVRRAGLEPAELSRVYVVGGATRTPLVVRLIAEELGIMPVTWGDPKAAVVLGAASPAARSHLQPSSAPAPVPEPVPQSVPEPGLADAASPAETVTTADLSVASTGELRPAGDDAEPIDVLASVEPSAPGTRPAADPLAPEPTIPGPEPAATIEPPPHDGPGARERTTDGEDSTSRSELAEPDGEVGAPAARETAFNPLAVAVTLACATAAVILIVFLAIVALT